jgi:hypothetical protein
VRHSSFETGSSPLYDTCCDVSQPVAFLVSSLLLYTFFQSLYLSLFRRGREKLCKQYFHLILSPPTSLFPVFYFEMYLGGLSLVIIILFAPTELLFSRLNCKNLTQILIQSSIFGQPVTVVARSKAWNVFARLSTGILGSNPARGMDVCVYSVFVLSCVGSGLATGWSLVQGFLPTVYKCKITEPHKEEAKARYGLQRHIRRRRYLDTAKNWCLKPLFILLIQP